MFHMLYNSCGTRRLVGKYRFEIIMCQDVIKIIYEKKFKNIFKDYYHMMPPHDFVNANTREVDMEHPEHR